MTKTVRAELYIGGEWVKPQPGHYEDVINPATEQAFAQAPVGTSQDVLAAISAARQAFDHGPWPKMTTTERVAKLRQFLDALAARREALCTLLVAEAGSVQAGLIIQFDYAFKHARQLLNDALTITPGFSQLEVNPSRDGRKVLGTSAIVHEPMGVVAAITPYNFPFFMNVVKVMHALPMGNTVVLKPSPLTPLTALVLGEAAHEVGLPPGVLNIVTGDIEAGTLLTTDKRVDMVTFTGSDKVGSLIMAQAAPTLKKLHLELGGKSALIIREDADLDLVMGSAMLFTIHSGQGCALTTRHLVHNALRAQYVERLSAAVKTLKIGDPADPTVMFGPLIREAARARTEGFVASALEQGARLVTGGRRPAHLPRGFYFEPTIFDDVDNRSRLGQEEVFGPIAAVIGFDTDEQAIAMANDSDFGLHGQIFSRDTGRAYELALQLRTGGVALNAGPGTMLSNSPFGGYKRSGLGREYGRDALIEFCQTKSISFQAA